MKEKYRDILNVWALYLALSFTILLKLLVFHSTVLEDGIQSFFPITCRLMTALLLASPVFFCKRREWIWVLLIAADIWMICNTMYYRANELFITMDSIRRVGGLQSYKDSLLVYMSASMLINPLVTALALWGIRYIPKSDRRTLWSGLVMLLVFGVWMVTDSDNLYQYRNGYLEWRENIKFYAEQGEFDTRYRQDHLFGKYGQYCFTPYANVRRRALYSQALDSELVRHNDILWYGGAILVYDWVVSRFEDMPVSKPTQAEVMPFLNESPQPDSITTDLIMVLVESLETWPLLQRKELSELVAPNLMRLIEAQRDNMLYCTQVRTQVRHGVSGDGQMLLNTGLLPLANNAACLLYAENVWPNIAGHFPRGVVASPSVGAWNQKAISPAYGYREMPVTGTYPWRDAENIDIVCSILDTLPSPFCLQTITLDMHTPFNRVKTKNLVLDPQMPEYLAGYLECLHYTDSCLGVLFDYMDQTDRWARTTLVITGDHTVFKPGYLRQFAEFNQTSEWEIPTIESACPLIIVAPHLQGRQIVEPVWQMDLFPTVCDVAGIRSNLWRGMGIDLITTLPTEREYQPDKCSAISERLIRTNWFAETEE